MRIQSVFLVFTLLPFVGHAQNDAPEAGSEAIVTMRINGLEAATWSGFAQRIGREPGANVEYSCLRAGVVVLRLQHLSVSEKADVISVAKRLLNEAGVKNKVEFLDVHVEQQNWGECALPSRVLHRAA